MASDGGPVTLEETVTNAACSAVPGNCSTVALEPGRQYYVRFCGDLSEPSPVSYRCFDSSPGDADPPYEYHSFAAPAQPTAPLVTARPGWQIYPGGRYRYGPSIMRTGDGTLHMWTCSPGEPTSLDAIRYRSSDDDGRTWTPDVIALAPTPGSPDAQSACDPSVVRIEGYYYLAYGSTPNSQGTDGFIAVARSTSPEGPYSKWNGSSWGGAPVPIISYTGPPGQYGVGEPSLVLREGRLHLYFTSSGTGRQVELATVDSPVDSTWPGRIVRQGQVLTQRDGEDQVDVKWAPALNRFIGIGTNNRFGVNASVAVYQSDDGRAFERAPFRGVRVEEGAHNAGISADPSGHLLTDQPTLLGYAYQPAGNTWGNWPTFLHPVDISTVGKGLPVGGSAFSTLNWSWSAPYLWNGDSGAAYSSDFRATPESTELVALDMGFTTKLYGITLTPRAQGYGFPRDFHFQVSNDGFSWTDVPAASYTQYPPPGDGNTVTFRFAAPIQGRFVRLVVTRFGVDNFGNHYLQLREMAPILR